MDRRNCGRPPKFVFAACAVGALFIFSGIVMWLWNATLPSAINVNEIGYWQAMGILVLSKILFSGFGGKGRRFGGGSSARFREKFRSMSDEEKESFKEAWRNRCRKYGS